MKGGNRACGGVPFLGGIKGLNAALNHSPAKKTEGVPNHQDVGKKDRETSD